MAGLSAEEKQKIEAEENFRAEIREKIQKKRKKRGNGCFTILALLFIIGAVVIYTLFNIASESIQTAKLSISTSRPESNIGRHAYNASNGVYVGLITDYKDCRTIPQMKCYVIVRDEQSSRDIERPVENIKVRDFPPEK